MTAANPARCTPESLWAWGRDYDGSPLPEDAAPMPGLTVGHLYDAAARIAELEGMLQDAVLKRRLYTELCVHSVKARWAKDEAKVERIMAAIDVIAELWPAAAKEQTP